MRRPAGGARTDFSDQSNRRKAMRAPHSKSQASILALALSLAIAGGVSGTALAEECTPEGVEKDMTAASIPAELPAAIPLPGEHFVMSANATPADEWNPYPNATIELLVDGSKDEVFRFYEEKLPAAGYQIVMWEKDIGATGLRFRGDGIDQATIAINDYDCRAYVMLNVSLLP